MDKNFVVGILEILGLTAIVLAIWAAFGYAAFLAAFGVALLVIAGALTLRR